MRRFVLRLFAAIGVVGVLAITGVSVAVRWMVASRPTLPRSMVLSVDFAGR